MEEMRLIDILSNIANDKVVPKIIKYELLQENYQELIYDESELEYRFRNDYDNFLTIPNHHLKDKVKIISWN